MAEIHFNEEEVIVREVNVPEEELNQSQGRAHWDLLWGN